ncbi:MAG TPA: low affinity iron permease family protein [Burkholderiaceae bacterium]|nr:low affinity iron permease family protein [Burkholderiaceae bacterium]
MLTTERSAMNRSTDMTPVVDAVKARREADTDSAPGSTSTTHAAGRVRHSIVLTQFDRFSARVTRVVGSPLAFTLALACVVLWAAVGHLFGYSQGWQLVINTGTTIVTFLVVFLIQQSQNKDSVALHLKLDELLASSKQASNRMIGIEDLDEQDLRDVAAFYVRLTQKATTAGSRKECHSIDDEGTPADVPHVSTETSATVGITLSDSGGTRPTARAP